MLPIFEFQGRVKVAFKSDEKAARNEIAIFSRHVSEQTDLQVNAMRHSDLISESVVCNCALTDIILVGND